MRIDASNVYFNAVLGALGGAVGWLLTMLAPMPTSQSAWAVYVRDAMIGLLVGASIGAFIGSGDGLLANRSLMRWLRGAWIGTTLGAAGGAVGLVFAEFIFSIAGGGLWPRAFGWAVFGMLVGCSDGFAQAMPTKLRYGLIGGLFGGLIGGAAYEGIANLFLGREGNRAAALAWSGAVGLVILGACIGAFVGLVESLLRLAELKFLNMGNEGQSRMLDPKKASLVLGRSPNCDVILPGDPSVGDVHAQIQAENGQFILSPKGGQVLLAQASFSSPVLRHVLQDGDRFQLGNTRIQFHLRGDSASSSSSSSK